MSALSDRIMDDIKQAMRDRDSSRTTVLRGLRAAFKNAAIEKRSSEDLSEDEEIAIIRKQIKQRQDSAASYRDAGRVDLAEVEEKEMGLLEGYLPKPLDPEAVEKIVHDAIAETGAASKADMGKVMAIAKEKCAGRVDGGTLSQVVRRHLA